MDLRKLIVEYLERARLMQVATTKGSQPWACSVYFAYDANFNIYWVSKPSRRHSEEIRANSKIAGTIVLPHTPGDDVRGIQYQGIAEELTGEDARPGLELYAKRYKTGSEWVEKVIKGENGHFCYHINPSLIVLFDEVNFPDNPRQEYKV